MKLPNADHAFVEPRKLTAYLLAHDHPEGGSKARFFTSVGFTLGNAALLGRALLKVARNGEVVKVESSGYGMKYVVDGAIVSLTGRTVDVRTVWIIERGQDRPRLLTAYPAT